MTSHKIKCRNELPEALARARAQGKTIVHAHGVFDLLDEAGVRHLERAKAMGDLLVVTLVPDAFRADTGASPRIPEDVRANLIASLDAVDLVHLVPAHRYSDAIGLIRPDLVATRPAARDAAPSEDAISRGAAAVAVGARVQATESVIDAESPPSGVQPSQQSPEVDAFLADLNSRYSPSEILARVEWLRNLRVLIVGEAILDEYVYCDPLGKSGKEPILVMRHRNRELQVGGSLAVANHVAAFCRHVGVLTCLGDRERHEDFVRSGLKPNIDQHILTKTGSPTIRKRRYLDPNAKLFGVYHLEDTPLAGADEAAFVETLARILPDYDAVIVADYGHGLITQRAIDLLESEAKFLAVNTQLNAANAGFHTMSRYARADYVCVHEGEIRLEARDRTSDVRLLMSRVANQLGFPTLMVTQGKRGTLHYRTGEGILKCPALARNVVERVGAGDAVFALTSLCEAADTPADITSFLGNLAGAQAVCTIGNRTSIRRNRLLQDVRYLMKIEHKRRAI